MIAGRADTTFRAPFGDAARHISWRQESWVIDIDNGHSLADRRGCLDELRQADRVAVAFPLAHGFTQNPQAHDIAHQQDASINTYLVRESAGTRRLGDHW